MSKETIEVDETKDEVFDEIETIANSIEFHEYEIERSKDSIILTNETSTTEYILFLIFFWPAVFFIGDDELKLEAAGDSNFIIEYDDANATNKLYEKIIFKFQDDSEDLISTNQVKASMINNGFQEFIYNVSDNSLDDMQNVLEAIIKDKEHLGTKRLDQNSLCLIHNIRNNHCEFEIELCKEHEFIFRINDTNRHPDYKNVFTKFLDKINKKSYLNLHRFGISASDILDKYENYLKKNNERLANLLVNSETVREEFKILLSDKSTIRIDNLGEINFDEILNDIHTKLLKEKVHEDILAIKNSKGEIEIPDNLNFEDLPQYSMLGANLGYFEMRGEALNIIDKNNYERLRLILELRDELGYSEEVLLNKNISELQNASERWDQIYQFRYLCDACDNVWHATKRELDEYEGWEDINPDFDRAMGALAGMVTMGMGGMWGEQQAKRQEEYKEKAKTLLGVECPECRNKNIERIALDRDGDEVTTDFLEEESETGQSKNSDSTSVEHEDTQDQTKEGTNDQSQQTSEQTKYWAYIEEETKGPFTKQDLSQNDKITATTRICALEEGNWKSAAEIDAVKELFKPSSPDMD